MSVRKITAIVFGVVLILGSLLFVGYYWFQSYDQKVSDQTKNAKVEAAKFGGSTDDLGCFEESLTRFYQCEGGFTCNVVNNTFFFNCLKASAPVSGFCDGVPKSDATMHTLSWRLEQCEKFGRNKKLCANFFAELQDYCNSFEESASDND